MSDDELIRAIEEVPLPVANAEAVASDLEITTAGTRKRLNALVEEGGLAAAEVGASTVYWVPSNPERAKRYYLRKGTVYVDS